MNFFRMFQILIYFTVHADVFDDFFEVPVNEHGFNPLHLVQLPGHTWRYDLKSSGMWLRTIQDKIFTFCFKKYWRW